MSRPPLTLSLTKGERGVRPLLLAGALLVTACDLLSPPRDWQIATAEVRGPGTAFARLHDRDGRSVGDVHLRTAVDGIEAEAELHRLLPGRYSIALHASGGCPGAGGRNPLSVGPPLPLDPSGNQAVPFQASADGGARFRFEVAAPLGSLLDWNGSSVTLLDGAGAIVACGDVRL